MNAANLEGVTRKLEHAMAVAVLLRLASPGGDNAATAGELLGDLISSALLELQSAAQEG